MTLVERRSGLRPWFSLQGSANFLRRTSLGYRVVAYVLVISTLLAIASTAAQMLLHYNEERSALIKRVTDTAPALLTALDKAAELRDAPYMRALLEHVLDLQDIEFVALHTLTDHVELRSGSYGGALTLQEYVLPNTPEARLQIGLGFDSVDARVKQRVVATLFTEMTKVLLVGMSVLWIFERIAARRLRLLADQVLHSSWRDAASIRPLHRSQAVLPDEIDGIIDALETMRREAHQAFDNLEQEKWRADRLNLSLQASQNEQGDLTTALSHDLITPVNTMQILLDELRTELGTRDQIGAETRDLIGDMRRTADRMRFQVQSIVNYSELLMKPTTLEAVALEDVLRNCKMDLSHAFDIDLDQLTWGPLDTICGDAADLTMLFDALLSNAVIYSSPDRRAAIYIRRLPDTYPQEIRFEVSDNGIGIPKEHLDTVFGLFTRLHTYSDKPGAGIGLPLCRRIMDRHGGRIFLNSQIGLGTTITLCFPKGDTLCRT